MAESFITVLNGVITGKHHGDANADLFGTPYYGHEILIVPFEGEAVPLEPLAYYTPDWKRKPDALLVKEGILPMPAGYVWEGGELRAMSADERVIAGLDEPQPGYKVEDGQIIEMAIEEKIAAGVITQEDYNLQIETENNAELQRRLAELQTPEVITQAEINEDYAAERKAKQTALLAVRDQEGWPLVVVWPE